jgi:large subunit ribosomal protein L4
VTPVPVLDTAGLAAGTAALAEAVASTPIKQHLIHETVVAELAGRRAGTHSTLTRGKVRGGGSKPWRQKGTGRARQGSTRSPQWTGGGVVFGPTPRSYGGKVNRKVRRQAFRAALRAHAERGSAAVMDATGWETPSTKAAAEYLRQAPDGLQARPLLLVVSDLDSVEARAFRNLEGVYVLAGAELETVDLVAAGALLVERAVWEHLTGGPIEVDAVSPKPKAKPKPKRAAPAEPANAVAAPAEEKPKRSRSRKAAPAADEATAEETPAAEAPEEAPAAEAEVDEAPVAEEPAAEVADATDEAGDDAGADEAADGEEEKS